MTKPMTDVQLTKYEEYYAIRSDGDAHAVMLCVQEIRRLRGELEDYRNKVAEFIAGEEDPDKYQGEVTRLRAEAEQLKAKKEVLLKANHGLGRDYEKLRLSYKELKKQLAAYEEEE